MQITPHINSQIYRQLDTIPTQESGMTAFFRMFRPIDTKAIEEAKNSLRETSSNATMIDVAARLEVLAEGHFKETPHRPKLLLAAGRLREKTALNLIDAIKELPSKQAPGKTVEVTVKNAPFSFFTKTVTAPSEGTSLDLTAFQQATKAFENYQSANTLYKENLGINPPLWNMPASDKFEPIIKAIDYHTQSLYTLVKNLHTTQRINWCQKHHPEDPELLILETRDLLIHFLAENRETDPSMLYEPVREAIADSPRSLPLDFLRSFTRTDTALKLRGEVVKALPEMREQLSIVKEMAQAASDADYAENQRYRLARFLKPGENIQQATEKEMQEKLATFKTLLNETLPQMILNEELLIEQGTSSEATFEERLLAKNSLLPDLVGKLGFLTRTIGLVRESRMVGSEFTEAEVVSAEQEVRRLMNKIADLQEKGLIEE